MIFIEGKRTEAGPTTDTSWMPIRHQMLRHLDAAMEYAGYARLPADHGRFTDFLGSTESIVTSSAQSDSGLFETNLRDERYLPFEHAGVISDWRISLPADPSAGDATQFDYQTISDVILHVRYTAREGGTELRRAALENLTSAIDEAQAAGCKRLFSVRDEFPTEWARFQGQTVGPNDRFELALSLREEHYPFWSRGRLKTVRQVQLTARRKADVAAGNLEVFDKRDRTDPTAKKDILSEDATLGRLLVGKFTQIDMPSSPVGPLKLFFESNEIRDLWITVTWAGEP